MSLHSSYGPNPIENLTLSDPRCNNDSCTAFQAAHNLSQVTVSYSLQYDYGHWTAWYYAIIILIFACAHGWQLWATRSIQPNQSSTSARIKAKLIAAGRYVTYRRSPPWLGLPSCGILMPLALTILFITILTFAVRPYYRQHRGYGSPPLAVRTGLMAAAFIPLIVGLSGKANFVTLLTGIGHERLNVFHRWAGWICLALSVVHTIPFIVAPLKDGGYAALHKQFYKPGAFEYTGVPPLAILVATTLFSLPVIRHRFYESFYVLHIALYIMFLGLCFWHFGYEGDSWAYLWATLAIFLAGLAARVFWFNRAFNLKGRWMVGSPLELEALAGGMTRLNIQMPLDASVWKWKPGQHCFLRLPSLDPWGNHPFTIASAWQHHQDAEKIDDNVNARFFQCYVRTQQGFTKALADYASNNHEDSTYPSAWVEGPYGGVPYKVENAYDHLLLVAGGGGMTACLPWLEHLAGMRKKGQSMRVITVHFVWVTRRAAHLEWAADRFQAIENALTSYKSFLKTSCYVTDHEGPEEHDRDEPVEGAKHPEIKAVGRANSVEDGSQTLQDSITTQPYKLGRPCMAKLIPNLLVLQRRNLIIGCGPASLKTDLSNTCAQLQTRVLTGMVEEIALHTETFGW